MGGRNNDYLDFGTELECRKPGHSRMRKNLANLKEKCSPTTIGVYCHEVLFGFVGEPEVARL